MVFTGYLQEPSPGETTMDLFSPKGMTYKTLTFRGSGYTLELKITQTHIDELKGLLDRYFKADQEKQEVIKEDDKRKRSSNGPKLRKAKPVLR